VKEKIIEWIKIKDRDRIREELPKEKQFFCIWKGTFSICEFDEEEDAFYITMAPAIFPGSWKLPREREGKITHYFIPEYPKDW
jgi:hypothetical protein